MKLNRIYSAILLSTLPLTPALAAGLDRSGQSIAAFLQLGNYAEAGISILDPKVQSNQLKVNDMAEDYYFPSAAIKVQATEHISIGLLYDQPFGAESLYPSNNPVFGANGEATQVEVETHNLSALIGYQPTENWNFYAGPVWQTVEADISLRGQAYISPKDPTKVLSGYDIKIHEEEAFGWLAGFAYQIPAIALKAAVTYRSEISHNAKAHEETSLGNIGLAHLSNRVSSVEAITPQSVNLDFQTGIAKDTLAFANIRWVHWDQFAVTPSLLAEASSLKGNKQNLIDYSDDQWSANIGVGHKFNDKWSASTSVGWDSGAGNPVTTLGPTEGYWSLGLGAQYSPAENYFIQGGVKYFWLGDATAKAGKNELGDFEDNHALGYGLKIGYRF
ncbi:outer membrane protein transport protein [Acinetobacter variabilis]|uniref:OmpP1/FadL family transporter n=1 Tax=Acinetobacter variabilis TaxID=70346 RepID=UPI000F66AEB2|nr:outer membrane protein transport protein [Acinetobacter variabilis]QXR18611.1 outer membrane protein transport protein [Acinetobacter variabilis]